MKVWKDLNFMCQSDVFFSHYNCTADSFFCPVKKGVGAFHLWEFWRRYHQCNDTNIVDNICSHRAGRLVIKRSLVQIPAPGKAGLHVEVSLSKILNPTLLISEGPAMSWRLIQGVPYPRPETRLGLAPAATSRNPVERDKRLRIMTWHDICSYWGKLVYRWYDTLKMHISVSQS